MRIIVFIQDEHSIKEIMRAEGLPDFRDRPVIAKFMIPLPRCGGTGFEPSPDDF